MPLKALYFGFQQGFRVWYAPTQLFPMSFPKVNESGMGPVPLASEVEGSVALDPAPGVPKGKHSSDALIRRGFFAAVVFSMLGFCTVAVYLFYFAFQMNAAFGARSVGALHSLGSGEELQVLFVHVAAWHFGLQSCGVMAGVVLGFLGLALFLLGIQGDIEGTARVSGYSFQFSHMAPGTLVILAATILIGICATRTGAEVAIGPSGKPPQAETATPDRGSAATGAPAQVGSVPDPTANTGRTKEKNDTH